MKSVYSVHLRTQREHPHATQGLSGLGGAVRVNGLGGYRSRPESRLAGHGATLE